MTIGSLVLPDFGYDVSDVGAKVDTVEVDGKLVLNVKLNHEMRTATLEGQLGGKHKIVVLWEKVENADV